MIYISESRRNEILEAADAWLAQADDSVNYRDRSNISLE